MSVYFDNACPMCKTTFSDEFGWEFSFKQGFEFMKDDGIKYVRCPKCKANLIAKADVRVFIRLYKNEHFNDNSHINNVRIRQNRI